MTVRPRLEEEQIALVRRHYELKNQSFKNDTHMIEYLLESFIYSNGIELLNRSEVLDNTIKEIIDSNVKTFSETITSDILGPLRDLAINSTMIINLLSEELYVGLTETEKNHKLIEIKKEALKAMAVDKKIQSLEVLHLNK